MSKYVDEVLEELKPQLGKEDVEPALELVRKKLGTSWRNGYKAGYQDGKEGNVNKIEEDKSQEPED